MRLARFEANGETLLGVVEGQGVMQLSGRLAGVGRDMIGLIAAWVDLKDGIRRERFRRDYELSQVRLLAPVQRPGKIMGLGLNYSDHIAEANRPPPEHQLWFSKAVTAVAGPFDPIQRPAVSDRLDYEGELVFIIGQGGRHLTGERAQAAIFGYCVGDDVSVRDWQTRTGQYTIGKSFDTHAPFGPFIVTADELDASALALRSYVNGEKRQESNTRHMIFGCRAQVEHLSQAMTLEPGDVIFTGTPGGIGATMTPPRFLAPGDRVRIEIDGIGHIENEVVDEVAGAVRQRAAPDRVLRSEHVS